MPGLGVYSSKHSAVGAPEIFIDLNTLRIGQPTSLWAIVSENPYSIADPAVWAQIASDCLIGHKPARPEIRTSAISGK
ncbi:MAG: hypothetical protein IT488_09515 [Gammaproteobacteria bacterium]|nr:hypothetical protein [Gammaproteobacteria bacterium]